MKLETLVAEWKAYHDKLQDLRPATIYSYTHHLKQFLAAFDGDELNDLMPKPLRTYIAAKCGSSKHLGHAALAAIRSLIGFANDEGYLLGDPTKSIKGISPPEGTRKPAKEADIRKLFAACDKRFPAQRSKSRAILALAVYGGLRAAEISLFTLADLDCETGLLVIPNGKGGKRRIIYVCRECIHCLQQHFKDKDAAATIGLTTAGIRYSIDALCKVAGVGHLTPHNFRHSCATRLLNKGANVKTVQTFLGHASLATTSKYCHTNDAQLIEAGQIASLDNDPLPPNRKQKPLVPSKQEKLALREEQQAKKPVAVRFDGRTKEVEQKPTKRIQRVQRCRRV